MTLWKNSSTLDKQNQLIEISLGNEHFSRYTLDVYDAIWYYYKKSRFFAQHNQTPYSRITQCQSHSFLNWNMEVYGTTLDMHMQTVKVSTLAYDISCFKCKARLREKLVDEFLHHLNTLINIRTQINRQHSRRYKYSL